MVIVLPCAPLGHLIRGVQGELAVKSVKQEGF